MYKSRITPAEECFGLFLAQIAPSLSYTKRAVLANLRLDLDQVADPVHSQVPELLINWGKMIFRIAIYFFSQAFEPE